MLNEADSLKGHEGVTALIWAASAGCVAVYQKAIGPYGFSNLFQIFQLPLQAKIYMLL